MSRRSRPFLIALGSAIIASVLTLAVPAVADVGAPLVVGKPNDGETKTTELTTKVDGAGLKFTNEFGGVRAAFRVDVPCPPPDKKKCAPGISTNSQGKAKNLNADFLDDKDSSFFLPKNGKANDADKLDGLDSTEILGEAAAGAPSFDAVTASNNVSSSSQFWSDVPNMTAKITVPTNQMRRALVSFSAENRCTQIPADTAYCTIQLLVDGAVVGDGIVLNSVQQGANDDFSAYARASHGFEWLTDPLAPGDHMVTVQYAVDAPDATISLSDRTLSVISFPA